MQKLSSIDCVSSVSDEENLEKEKRALEKNNQILSARLNDLGKTVNNLTQSQQSEKPFPQMAWMDSTSLPIGSR